MYAPLLRDGAFWRRKRTRQTKMKFGRLAKRDRPVKNERHTPPKCISRYT